MLWTLAQAAGEQWWETIPAQIVLWGTALFVLLSVLKRLFGGAEFTRRLFLAMLALGETDKWPNGSRTLPGSLTAIYDKLTELEGKFDEHIDDFDEHVRNHRSER